MYEKENEIDTAASDFVSLKWLTTMDLYLLFHSLHPSFLLMLVGSSYLLLLNCLRLLSQKMPLTRNQELENNISQKRTLNLSVKNLHPTLHNRKHTSAKIISFFPCWHCSVCMFFESLLCPSVIWLSMRMEPLTYMLKIYIHLWHNRKHTLAKSSFVFPCWHCSVCMLL